MVKFYLKRIEKGLITIEDVPKLWREKVKAELQRKESEVNEKDGQNI